MRAQKDSGYVKFLRARAFPRMTQADQGFTDAIELLDRLPRVKVAVVGDIMLDEYVYGNVSRISPEAPVPVMAVRRDNAMLGGAGNVLANLRGLDVACATIAVVGQDDAADAVMRLVREKGDAGDGILRVPHRPTTIKTRFVAGNQQLLRCDRETSAAIAPDLERDIEALARRLFADAGAVVLSDYGKGMLTPGLIAALIRLAGERGVPVLVDPKGADYAIYRGATAVTPNRKELAEATGGMPTASDDDIVAAATALIQRTGVDAVIATRSEDGMSIVRRDRPPVHLRTEAVEVFDVSGAGDTVIATIAAMLAAGADLVAAASIANTAGGIVVAKVGTAAIHRRELGEALVHRDLAARPANDSAGNGRATVIDRTREGMVLRLDEAREQVARWQARGLRVGWTNGCFDILHAGHVGYLNRARDFCDRLIVGLNSDASVRRLKGESRPVNHEAARATVMAGLGAVDLVVPFGDDPADDDKPVRAVTALKPDILFKGGDYVESQLPEAAAVRAYGGDVRIMPFTEGHSTTSIIGKIQGRA